MSATILDASGCTVRPAITPSPKIVAVNGTVIPRAAIARETQNHPAARPIEAWQAAARALVVRELLLQEARRLGLAPTPATDAEGRRETDEEALVRGLVEREVRTPEAGEDACRRYHASNRQRFRTPELHEVRHILFAAPPDDAKGRIEAMTSAEAVIATLQQEPGAFAALAAAHSACPSREVGGSLGQIGPGQTVPEFERALPALPLGEVAPAPVETRYGAHVVFVERRIAGRELPFEVVHPRIATWLGERVRHAAIRQYIGILAGRAEITGITMAGHDSPLVQ